MSEKTSTQLHLDASEDALEGKQLPPRSVAPQDATGGLAGALRRPRRKHTWEKLNYEKNKIQQRVRWARWYAKHKDEPRQKKAASEASKRSWAKHRPRLLAKQRAKYWADPAKWRAYAAKWAKDNWETTKVKLRERYSNDQEYRLKVLHYCHVRRVRERKATHADAKKAVENLATKKFFKCFYCGKQFKISDVQIDHVRPLAKGGQHTAYNIVPSCADCNMHKQARMPNAFITKGQLLLTY